MINDTETSPPNRSAADGGGRDGLPSPDQFTLTRRRHWVQWIVALVIVLVAADLVHGAATNPRIAWDVVADYMFDSRILAGLRITLALTAVSQVLATVLGLLVAVMAMSSNPILIVVSRLYITIFRSVPTIVQMLFWYYLAAVLPTLPVGLPFGPSLITFDTNILITQFAAAMMGLALGEAAFLAEYFRGAVLSVPAGQKEAAAACGLTSFTTFRRVVAPQAMRVVLPAYGNTLIINLKNTSSVFVIGAGDLMTRAQLIYSQNFQQIPLLIVVITWYLALVVAMTAVQRRVERHYARGFADSMTSTRHRAKYSEVDSQVGTSGELR